MHWNDSIHSIILLDGTNRSHYQLRNSKCPWLRGYISYLTNFDNYRENCFFSIEWGKYVIVIHCHVGKLQSAFWTYIRNPTHYKNMFQHFGGTNFIVQMTTVTLHDKIRRSKICRSIYYSKKNSWKYIILYRDYFNVRPLLLHILARRLVLKYRQKKWLKENSWCHRFLFPGFCQYFLIHYLI